MIRNTRRGPFPQTEPVENGQRIGEGSRVWGGGAGGDPVERVADDVGNDQGQQSFAAERFRQSAPFHARQVFPHRVHFANGGSTGVQKFRDGLFVFERDVRYWGGKEGGTAAGKEADRDVFRLRRSARKGEHLVGPRDPGGPSDDSTRPAGPDSGGFWRWP